MEASKGDIVEGCEDMYRIVGKVRDINSIAGVIAEDQMGRRAYIDKKQLNKYRYTNAKISKDLKIISGSDIITVGKNEAKTYLNSSIVLYHGSQNGIQGKISVSYSNRLCDFGKGFYLGDNINQAINRVCSVSNSILYEFKLNINNYSIYEFNNKVLWALYIGRNRNKISIEGYDKLQRIFDKIDSYDIIAGIIADDKVAESFNYFIKGMITDKALIASLSEVKYGKQYVIKNQKVINNNDLIELRRKTLDTEERKKSLEWGRSLKKDLTARLNELRVEHRRDGKFIDEIMEEFR